MATSRKRSSGSTPISKSAIDHATSVLQGLPEKEKDTLSLRDAVELLQDSIVESLSKGYSHEEVAAMLTERGVTINAPSLKYYLTALRRKNKTSGRAKTRRPRKAKKGEGGEEAGSRKTAATGKSGVASVISYLMDDSDNAEGKSSRKRTSRKSAPDEAAPSDQEVTSKKRSTRSTAASTTTKAKPASRGSTRSTAKSDAAPKRRKASS